MATLVTQGTLAPYWMMVMRVSHWSRREIRNGAVPEGMLNGY